MARLLRVVAAIFGLIASATAAYGQSRPAPDTLAFTISLKEVRLVLPVGHRDRWHWRLPETWDNRREYGWEIALDTAGTRSFGFSLFKLPAPPPDSDTPLSSLASLPPDSGTLSDLLRAGQRGVWEERPGSHLGRLVREARITLSPTDSGVAVTITDPWTIDFLFGRRPLVGFVVLENPGRELTRIPIRFAYVPE